MPAHPLTIELSPCFFCKGELFAVFEGGSFQGLKNQQVYPIFYSDANRRQMIFDAIKRRKRMTPEQREQEDQEYVEAFYQSQEYLEYLRDRALEYEED